MKGTADVLVFGAGAAGAAAALMLARRGRRVALVDNSTPRRAFGEVLPPGALSFLTALGCIDILQSRLHRAAWGQQSAWGSLMLLEQDFTFHPGGCAWQLDRQSFDADLLACACRAGAVHLSGTGFRRAARRPDGSWLVTLSNSETLEARFLIDATGRASALARQLGYGRHRLDRLVALIGHVDLQTDVRPHLLIESQPCGWWSLSPQPHRPAVLVLVTDVDLVPAGQANQVMFWAREILNTVHVRSRVRLTANVEVRATPAGTEHLSHFHGDGWVAVGDAAASFDPLSAMGLAHALDTGRLAAIAVDASLADEPRLLTSYARVVRRRVNECDLIRRSYYAAERRWPAAPFWVRACQRGETVKHEGV